MTDRNREIAEEIGTAFKDAIQNETSELASTIESALDDFAGNARTSIVDSIEMALDNRQPEPKAKDEPKAAQPRGVASTANVNSTADVSRGASVLGRASVIDRAQVYDEAVVSGNATVSGYARVGGFARVSGEAVVTGYSLVRQHAEISGGTWVQGCFDGRAVVKSSADALAGVIQGHSWTTYREADGETIFSIGCQRHRLGWWTDSTVQDLVERESAHAHLDELRRLVGIVRAFWEGR